MERFKCLDAVVNSFFLSQNLGSPESLHFQYYLRKSLSTEIIIYLLVSKKRCDKKNVVGI
jgi:hypothetical protein